MNNPSELVEFLRKYLPNLTDDGGKGISLDFPGHDLMPFDYLEFAQKALEQPDVKGQIDCVSHLKRAMECELDTLFHVMGVRLTKAESNVPTKLPFVGQMGIMGTRS